MPGAARDGRYNLEMLRKLAFRPDWQIAMLVTAALRLFYTAMAAAFMPFLHPDPALIHSNALTENLPPPHGLHYALLEFGSASIRSGSCTSRSTVTTGPWR